MRNLLRAALTAVALLACGEADAVQHPTPLRDLSASLLYPIGLWDQGVDGQTIVMVHVTDMGAVDSTYVANSSGFRAFDSVAAAGLKQARFVPARRGERRIAMWVRVPV
ncbi:MAG: energy transducer TonB family protein, partial [Longimicrobiales bacterium]